MKLAQVAVPAEDLARASVFYSALLGAEPVSTFDPPGLLFFDLEGVRLMVSSAGSGPASLIYLNVTNLSERIEALRLSGVTIESEPHVIFRHEVDTLGPVGTDEWQAFIRDSEGNLVGLVEHVPY